MKKTQYVVYWQVSGQGLQHETFNTEQDAQNKVNGLNILRWHYTRNPYWQKQIEDDDPFGIGDFNHESPEGK